MSDVNRLKLHWGVPVNAASLQIQTAKIRQNGSFVRAGLRHDVARWYGFSMGWCWFVGLIVVGNTTGIKSVQEDSTSE